MKLPAALAASLLATVSARAADPVPATLLAGVNSPVSLALVVYTNGAASGKYGNKEVLTAMSTYHDPDDTSDTTSTILDGSIKGWSLTRLTDDADAGDLFAVKAGKAAVRVPTSILTQPIATSRAAPSTTSTSTTVNNKVYGTMTVNGGDGTFSGNENVKPSGVKIVNTGYPVITRTELFNVSGSISDTSLYIGTYKVTQSVPQNIIRFFPDGLSSPADDPSSTLPAVSVTAPDATAKEAPASTDTGTFTFTRNRNLATALTISVAWSGTATNGVDYNALPTSITFPAGQGSVSINVVPIDDALVEGSETVIGTVTAGVGYTAATGAATATVTILDDEVPATVSVAAPDPSAAESASGTETGTFTFSRTGVTTSSLTLNVTWTGTATNGTDYNSLPNTVTIPAGQSSVDVIVTPINDALVEGSETVIATITAGAGYTFSPTTATATVTIIDDDTP